MSEVELDALEILEVARQIDPRLVELAIERCRAAKLAERVAELERDADQ